MTDQPRPQHLRMIPIDRIEVLNPRARNKRLHREIVDNIDAVGLKRPVTVRRHPDDPEHYDLVCGEGRLEAFRLLGQEKIPAVVIEAEEAECMVMSLVENIARRQHRPIDLMLEIGNLHQRGYTDVDIAEKIGCTQSWVNMIVTLLERGEERLVAAVETGLIPVSLAVDIARAKGDDVQALLKDLGIQRVECLISTDDETYTYNKRINRLAAVQEHSMIKHAVARGVPEAAIAEALGLDIKTIFRRTRLLNGICPEAVEVLKDTSAPMAVFDILRRMGPIRQVEAAELMAGQNNYSVQFAKALLAATPDAALAVPRRKPPKRDGQVSTEQMAKMERELASLQTQVKSFEETYGVDTLHLTVARGYIRKLLGNPKVVTWLGQHRGEYLGEFRSLTDSDGEGTDRTIG